MISVSRTFIETELNKLDPAFGLKLQGNMALIRCPDHKGGKEIHPSMRVNLEGNTKHKIGSGHCFVCGSHYSSWKKFYARITGKEFKENYLKFFEGTGSADYIKSLLEPKSENADDEFPNELNSLPWDPSTPWRSIDGKLMSAIGALYYMNPKIGGAPNAFLPCYVHSVLVGGIAANMEKIGKNNYFNTKGDWTHTTLFPFDYVRKMVRKRKLRYVLLVEGPRDALFLLQYGIPALSIMGTGHAGLPIKYMLLDDIEIDTVLLGFDADDAGREAKKKAKAILEGGFRLIGLKFDEGQDPATLNYNQIKAIKKLGLSKHLPVKTKASDYSQIRLAP